MFSNSIAGDQQQIQNIKLSCSFNYDMLMKQST